MDRVNLLFQFLVNNAEGEAAEAAYVAQSLAEEIEEHGTLPADELLEALNQFFAEYNHDND